MPTVVTIHDMLYWSHPELMVDAALHRAGEVDGEARRRATPTRVITDSQVSADEIVKYLGFPRERLHVVPLAATAPRATDASAVRAARTWCSPAASAVRTRTGPG